MSAGAIEFKLIDNTCVRVKCLLTDWPQGGISCDDTAVTFSLLQQNAHYMLELAGLSKSWEKLLFISGELRFKTSSAISKQKILRTTAYGWPCATFSLPAKFKH